MVETDPIQALIHQATIVGLLCAFVAGLGEWLHQRRINETRALSFGPEGPRGWTALVPFLRTAAALILGFSLWVLAHLESKPPEIDPTQEPSQHLLIALDVSPSMYLEDSGPERNIRRGTRASEVLEAVFQRLDMSRTRVSVVAFYTDAFPVVLESFDINVVNNVLNGLPMEFAFEAGSTQLQQGVEKALSFAKAWPKGSTTLIVVSDGDTVGGSLPARLPLSISDVLVLGVGDPHKGSSVAGRTSRQNIQALQRLAVRLGGLYHEANTKHLPTEVVRNLAMAVPSVEDQTLLRDLCVAGTGIGTGILALLPLLLAQFGRRSPRSRSAVLTGQASK